MDKNDAFREECKKRAAAYPGTPMAEAAARFMEDSTQPQYSYNFRWMDRPIIQYPQDMAAMQELIWAIRPDLIIETGIAHGGSLIMNASLLALLDYCDALAAGEVLDPAKPRRHVLGIDIDIRAHNRAAIEAHPMANRITMFEGSAISADMIAQVKAHAEPYKTVLVCLDSNHTHEHVLAELEGYAPLVTPGSYCVVFDTIVEHFPEGMYPDRPWGPGDNPKTAVHAYLQSLANEGRSDRYGQPMQFEVDDAMDAKLLISVAPGGYLKRTQ